MRFPVSLYISLTKSFVRNAKAGRKRFPLVLMLEPTHRCNLTCAGCDRIRLHDDRQSPDLSLEQCIEAVTESDAPVVTVTGGEPLLYKELIPLVREILRMKKHVYLCTNGLLPNPLLKSSSQAPNSLSTFIWTDWKRPMMLLPTKAGLSERLLRR